MEPAWDFLSPSLCAPPPLTCTRSLSKINKLKKIKGNVEGLLAGSGGAPQGCEFEPHIECRDYYPPCSTSSSGLSFHQHNSHILCSGLCPLALLWYHSGLYCYHSLEKHQFLCLSMGISTHIPVSRFLVTLFPLPEMLLRQI